MPTPPRPSWSHMGEPLEALAERTFVEARSPRQRGDLCRVCEIARTEPHHVLTRHLVALCGDIDRASPPLAGFIDYFRKRDRPELAALDGHERARSTVDQVRHRRVTEVARVLGVEWDRRRAAQLVSNRLVHDRDFNATLLQPHLHFVLDLASEVDFGHADVALGVAIDVLKLRHLARAEALDESFGQQHDAVRLA